MSFHRSIPFLARATPSGGGGGPTLIRFSSLTDMTETGNGTTGWIYTATASNGVAGGADYSIADSESGGIGTAFTLGGAVPVTGLYSAASGAWDANIYIIAYSSAGNNWSVNDSGFGNLVTTVRAYETGDLVRVQVDGSNGYNVDIARTAAPTTWLNIANGTLTRGVTVYPRVSSFSASGAVFTAPYRAV
jgi:hypothetical protein